MAGYVKVPAIFKSKGFRVAAKRCCDLRCARFTGIHFPYHTRSSMSIVDDAVVDVLFIGSQSMTEALPMLEK